RRRLFHLRFDGAVRHQPFAQAYAAPGGGAQSNDYDGKHETPGHPYPFNTREYAVYKFGAGSEFRPNLRLLTKNLAAVFPHGMESHTRIEFLSHAQLSR